MGEKDTNIFNTRIGVLIEGSDRWHQHTNDKEIKFLLEAFFNKGRNIKDNNSIRFVLKGTEIGGLINNDDKIGISLFDELSFVILGSDINESTNEKDNINLNKKYNEDIPDIDKDLLNYFNTEYETTFIINKNSKIGFLMRFNDNVDLTNKVNIFLFQIEDSSEIKINIKKFIRELVFDEQIWTGYNISRETQKQREIIKWKLLIISRNIIKSQQFYFEEMTFEMKKSQQFYFEEMTFEMNEKKDRRLIMETFKNLKLVELEQENESDDERRGYIENITEQILKLDKREKKYRNSIIKRILKMVSIKAEEKGVIISCIPYSESFKPSLIFPGREINAIEEIYYITIKHSSYQDNLSEVLTYIQSHIESLENERNNENWNFEKEAQLMTFSVGTWMNIKVNNQTILGNNKDIIASEKFDFKNIQKEEKQTSNVTNLHLVLFSIFSFILILFSALHFYRKKAKNNNKK